MHNWFFLILNNFLYYILNIFRFVSSYGKTIQDKSRYYKCIKTNKPYAGLKIPMKKVKSAKINFSKIGQKFIPSFNSRYYTEDVPTYKLIFKISFYSGLVSIKSLAEIAGIKTPSFFFEKANQ